MAQMTIIEEPTLAHERLDVYKCAIGFLALSIKTIAVLPLGYAFLADQFKRAALSIPLNIAEGAGKPNGSADSKRSYNIARGSAMECGAILDSLQVLELADGELIRPGKRLLVRVVAMLTKM